MIEIAVRSRRNHDGLRFGVKTRRKALNRQSSIVKKHKPTAFQFILGGLSIFFLQLAPRFNFAGIAKGGLAQRKRAGVGTADGLFSGRTLLDVRPPGKRRLFLSGAAVKAVQVNAVAAAGEDHGRRGGA